MVGYVMWQADRLPALARASTPRTVPAGTPALAVAPVGGRQATQACKAAPDPTSRRRRWGMLSRRLVGRENMPSPLAHQVVLSPRLAACCQIAMAITMGYMLILML